jgi:hypothetical protein
MDMTAPDYAESTYRVIGKLGEMLNEPPRSLMVRALSVRDDTLRFRIFSDHSGDRSLPLGFATSLVSGVQQLLNASACTVMRPRAHHPRLWCLENDDFPFVRRVTLSLKRGMEQLIGAIKDDTLDQFVESLKNEPAPLLSSNLCEALAQFYDEALLELRFRRRRICTSAR